MLIDPRLSGAALLLTGLSLAGTLHATSPDAADHSIRRFLEQDDTQHPYRAMRRLEATNGGRSGRVDVLTEYSPRTGFRYDVMEEGPALSRKLRAAWTASAT